jgi:hypothetical protein
MKLAVPSMPQLKPRERLIAFGAAAILLVVAVDRLVMAPWLRHADNVRQEIVRMERSLEDYRRLLSRREHILSQFEAYRAYMQAALPDELQMAALLKEVEGLAAETHVAVGEIKPLAAESDSLTKRYTLDVLFECTLEEWVDFVIRVESSPSLFSVSRASLAVSEDAPDKLRGTLRLVSTAMRIGEPSARQRQDTYAARPQ